MTTGKNAEMTRHPSPRKQIITLIEQGRIPAGNIDDALLAAQVRPDSQAWRTFIDRLLLGLGGLALAFSVLFFIAYNWNEIGRLAKFALVEASIVLAIAAYWKLDSDGATGKTALLVATVLVSVLLALFGQTYQTGADPWQLFFNWALLILPWALIGRFPAIWVLWVALLNLSIVLYQQAFQGMLGILFDTKTTVLWPLFLLNLAAWAAWEMLARNHPWLSARWAIRLLAAASGASITGLVVAGIFGAGTSTAAAGGVWGLWLAALYFIYRRIKPDLFMLAGGCLSGIVVTVAFVARHTITSGAGGNLLLIALLIIGLGTGAAVWLRNIQREFQS